MAQHTFDRGGEDDGTLTVELFSFYGGTYVCTDVDPAVTWFCLTAEQARAYAADLVALADELDARG
jgi:hypothetical protein